MTSMAKFCRSTKTIAPRNAPTGWRIPPSTAMIRMLMSQLVPTEPADERGGTRRDRDSDHHREPPRPAQTHAVGGRGAEDRHHVAGDAGHRHLRERDHAAVAAEERERQRDQPQRQRLRADLVREERRREPGEGDQERENDEMSEAQGILEPWPRRPRCT